MTRQHREPVTKIPDHCSAGGAAALARRIVKYWSERGASVVCTVVPGSAEHGRVARFDLRSDLIDGLPSRARAGR